MNDSSSSFPSFWRAPISKSSEVGHLGIMPGSTDQEVIMNEQEQVNLGNGLTEHRTHQYVNRPEGEMDMMIGFFLMNGFCVSFFLLFGLCVIFSCLRKRPAYFRRKQCAESEAAPPIPDGPAFKPKLKSIVSQVIKTNKVTTKITMDPETLEMESSPDDSQQTKLSAPQFSRSPTPTRSDRKTSLTASRQASIDHSRRCSTSVSQENSAMIRHNLLGPLSFDDLHYM
ncbi:Protein CBG09360 [Caenorhabditis briggsae]|uniref:Uncharacterized protein n=2 Tax=Caenorhabditis briggsae TaxID=6238 RepID=A0AAE9F5I9_CAEBR|nr:Protein CBG09360 [Caenorhabditis briggsae]ULT89991.1 hypothetical protein L3Y34_008406 [Caenorhabditis briggsae]UMM35793.1 hypothetical protein L5515_008254 [Caenorhabditis briggsae]CAP29212.1 Protein CBG09360 [Caenorhabditis briggsae]